MMQSNSPVHETLNKVANMQKKVWQSMKLTKFFTWILGNEELQVKSYSHIRKHSTEQKRKFRPDLTRQIVLQITKL